MISRNIWTEMKSDNVPKFPKPIGLKWILNIKSNGRYKALIIALRCNKFSGIDYNLSHAPVLYEIGIHILFLKLLCNDNWTIKQLDIEEAFLEGKLHV